jgi:hypothetical protein
MDELCVDVVLVEDFIQPEDLQHVCCHCGHVRKKRGGSKIRCGWCGFVLRSAMVRFVDWDNLDVV